MTGRLETEDPDRAIAQALRLRSPPAPVVRLSRRAVAVAGAAAAAAVAAITGWSLASRPARPPLEQAPAVWPADVRPPEQLAALPKDYADLPPGVPKLGPPLPGDLGRPILAARGQWRDPARQDPTTQAHDAERQAIDAERTQGRTSRLFASSAAAAASPPSIASSMAPPAEAGSSARPASVSPSSLIEATHILPAGTAIRAALITGIRSDLPGPVTAQVTEDVCDAVTGEVLLVPRGSRLLGAYDNKVAFGQSRVLLTWSRLMLPDGRTIELDNAPATDGAGYTGVQDRVDRHWRQLIAASLVSLGVAAAGEIGRSSDQAELLRALRLAVADTAAQVGNQVVDRSLSVQPTLSVRPGFPVRALLTTALALPAWSAR